MSTETKNQTGSSWYKKYVFPHTRHLYGPKIAQFTFRCTIRILQDEDFEGYLSTEDTWKYIVDVYLPLH